MRRPILNHTKRGELVYEPFLGSGTTLAAAEVTERVCCGIERDPKYVDVTVQRWQMLSGTKAKLDADGRSFEEIRPLPSAMTISRSPAKDWLFVSGASVVRFQLQHARDVALPP
jgi:hypothetical protein